MNEQFKKYLFMAKKFLKDVRRNKNIYEISRNLHGTRLDEYYFLMDEKELLKGHSQDFHFDEDGIPIIPTYIDVEDRKMIYYPISIGQFGLAIFHTYLKTKSEHDKERFFKILKWFYQKRISDKKLGDHWLTDVPKPEYRINKPWPSAFSQSRAISILLRGFQLTGDKKYLNSAGRALKIFEIPVSEGGVTTITDFGPFYEEYPASFPTMVLDGMFFSLCGLHDYIRAGENPQKAQKLFQQGVNTLKYVLPLYDLGYWIRYNYCRQAFYPKIDPATIGYLRLVINQLWLFYQLTGEPVFKQFATKWQSYDKLYNILKMYIIKYSALKKLNRI